MTTKHTQEPDLKHIVRDLIITGVLALVAIVVSVSAGWIVLKAPASPGDARSVAEISKRTIVDYSVDGATENATVTYSYLGDKLPEKLASDEVLEARTESSWTRRISTEGEQAHYELRAFPQKVFYKKGNDWYNREYGQVSKKVFDKVRKQKPLQAFFMTRVLADTLYSGSGDGNVLNQNGSGQCSTTWSATQSAGSGTLVDVSSTYSYVQAQSLNIKTLYCIISRSYLPINTSSIPSGAVVSSASLYLYATSTVSDGNNDGNDYVTVVQTSQSNSTTLATADYSAIASTEGIDSGSRLDLTGLASGQYYSFPLNATGRSWIKKSGQTSNCGSTAGVTCLGLREGHDINNSTVADDTNDLFYYNTSEWTGTSQDPYLLVTYTSFAFWQFQDY